MASTLTTRNISTIFLFLLSISGAILGLPLAGIDGENTDGQIAQPDWQQMFPADMPPPPPGAFNDPGTGVLPPNELPEPRSGDVVSLTNKGQSVDLPVEAAEVAGTGLGIMAGPVVPGGDTGDLFPNNMPPPPPGAMNDEVPQSGQVVPASNGGMFPDNMPPQPPGAMNDEVPQSGQVLPASNGNMFPDNMPPPPPGAMNDEVPQSGQVLPASNVHKFPENMPPPPSGAFTDRLSPLPEQGIEPQENEVNPDNTALPNKETVPPYRGMFPPNMPPPPPGAFNDPPPIQKLSEKEPNEPAFSSDGTAVEPVYINGMNVPDAAVVPPNEQNPFIDPNQRSPLPSNQQNLATANETSNTPQYNPNNIVSDDQNNPNSQKGGDPQALSPNTQDNTGEGQASYNPDDLDASNNPIPSENNQPAESVPNQNESQVPVNPNVPEADPSPTAQLVPNPDIPIDSTATDPEGQNENGAGNSWESSYESSYEGEQDRVNENSQEWSETPETFSDDDGGASEPDYSFLQFLESSVSSVDYESPEASYSFQDGGGAFDSFLENSKSEESAEFDSSYLEESSEYSDLGWLFNGDSSFGTGSEYSVEEEEEGEYFGGEEAEGTVSHDEEQKQSFQDTFIDAFEKEDELYRTGGTRLIIYCIPAVLLCVLVLLAWKNYRGKIRVVGVPSGDAKHYDWKSDRNSEEHAPMLLDDQDQDGRGY